MKVPASLTAMTDLSRAGVDETARLIANRDLTARVVVEEALGRIAAADPGLNAFSRVLADEARAEATARDEQLAASRRVRCTACPSRSRRRSTSPAP